MEVLYGEGYRLAFQRLMKEIILKEEFFGYKLDDASSAHYISECCDDLEIRGL